MGWFEDRFAYRDGKIENHCTECGRSFWMPPSKAAKYKRCSPECAAKWSEGLKAEKTTTCQHCGSQFVARRTQLAKGEGKYCSLRCSTSACQDRNAPEAIAKRAVTFAASLAAGRIKIRSGADHPQWTGGQKEAARRRLESGKAMEYTKKYRKENPERAREWARKRQSMKVARLPRGTTQKLGGMQGWKCAICRCSVKSNYHLDHIMPLALGGEHAPRNLQLLCPSCNVRKNAKHPVVYMQEVGFLI